MEDQLSKLPTDLWKLMFMEHLDIVTQLSLESSCKFFREIGSRSWNLLLERHLAINAKDREIHMTDNAKRKFIYLTVVRPSRQGVVLHEKRESSFPCRSWFYSRSNPCPFPLLHVPKPGTEKSGAWASNEEITVYTYRGKKILSWSSSEIDNPCCAKCFQTGTIYGAYKNEFYEVMQEAGLWQYVEVYCSVCKCYTVWTHTYTYYSSYY